MTSIVIPVVFRPMTRDDDPIVYDSWLGSLADELEIDDPDERRRFKRGQKPVVDGLLARGRTIVAAPRKEPDRVAGWVCVEAPDILHFVFVKRDFRRGQIARRLMEQAALPRVARASHMTSWGFPRIAKLFESLTHDPTLGAP